MSIAGITADGAPHRSEARSAGRDAPVRYLSTLTFPDAWLQSLAAAVPGVEVLQLPATHPGDIPGDVWRTTEVLHTHGVLPEPCQAPRLRWVQLDTSGVDHVIHHPVWDAPVDITTIGGVSPVPMGEYVMMMVLAFSHHLPALRAGQEAHDWPPLAERWSRYLPRPVPGATMGIIGFGRIGREIGRLARAFGMNVIGVRRGSPAPDPDPAPTSDGLAAAEGVAAAGAPPLDGIEVPPPGIEIAPPGELGSVLARCDYVVVTVPLTPQTTGLLDSEMLSRLRPGAVLIDVARGGVVDEDAVLAALDDGRLAGAALDVFATEPLPADSRLWGHPRVVVTPHVAGFAPAYETAVLDLVADNLRRYLAGHPLTNRVDRLRGY